MGMMTESRRHSMAVWGSLLCFLCIGPSIALIAAGGYAKVAVESKIRLIEGFNTAALPGVIVFLGLYCVIHNAAAGTVLMSVRKPRMRERRAGLLLPGVVMGMILFLCLFLMAGISFGQTMYLERSFDKGIVRAMKNYKSNRTLKAEIDNLQIDFKCCGNDRYTDWFKISWIREDYVNYDKKNRRTREGGYKNDDVPFSCCDAESERPCINHHVHDNDMHYSYDYRSKTTLYSRGCRESLVNFYGKQLMTYVGLTLFGVSFFQLIVVLLTRFLQTSIAKALELGDPEAETMGYFFSSKEESGEKGEDGKPLLDEDDEEVEDEEEDEEPPEDEDEEPPEEEDEEPEEDADYEDAYGGWEGYAEEGGDDDEVEDDEDEWAPPPRRRNRNRSNIGQYLNNTNNYLGFPVEKLKNKNQLGNSKRQGTVIDNGKHFKLALADKSRQPTTANTSMFPRTDISNHNRSSPRYLECLEFGSAYKSESTTGIKRGDKCQSKIAKVNAWIRDIKDNSQSRDSCQQPLLGSTLPLQLDESRNQVSEKKTADMRDHLKVGADHGFGHLESQRKGNVVSSNRYDIGYNHEENRNTPESPMDFNDGLKNNLIFNDDDQRFVSRNPEHKMNVRNLEVRERYCFGNVEEQIKGNTISTNRDIYVKNDKAVRNMWTSEKDPQRIPGFNGKALATKYDLGYQSSHGNNVYNHSGVRNTLESGKNLDKRLNLQNNPKFNNDIYLQSNDPDSKYDTSFRHLPTNNVLGMNNNDGRHLGRNVRPSNTNASTRIRIPNSSLPIPGMSQNTNSGVRRGINDKDCRKID